MSTGRQQQQHHNTRPRHTRSGHAGTPKQPGGFRPRTKFILVAVSVVLLVAILTGTYALGNRFKIGVTLSTNPNLRRDLEAHYSFDSRSMSWSAGSGQVGSEVGGPAGTVGTMDESGSFSASLPGAFAYGASWDSTLRKVDSTGSEVWSFTSFTDYVTDVAAENDGSHVYGVSADGTVRKIDSQGVEVWSFNNDFFEGESVAIEQDGNAVYAGTDGGVLYKIDSQGNEVWSFTGFPDAVDDVAVEDDGSYVYAISNTFDSGYVYKIDSSGNEVWSFTGFTNGVLSVSVTPSGDYVYAGGSLDDSTLRKIDSQGNEVWSFTGFSDRVFDVALEEDGSHVYGGSGDATIRKIDSQGNEVWSFTGFGDRVRSVAVEGSGDNVYGGSYTNTLRKIDSQGNEVWSFTGFTYWVWGAATSQASSAASSADQAAAGRIGQGFATGGDNYVDVGNVGSNIQTVAFWVKPDTDTEGLVQLSGSVTISLSSGSVSTSGFSSPTVYVDGEQTTSGVTAGEWHHIVITDTSTITADEVEVGHDGSSALDGAIDDVRFYSRVLNETDRQRLYELGATTRINTTIAENPAIRKPQVLHYSFDSRSMDWQAGSGQVASEAGGPAGTVGTMDESGSFSASVPKTFVYGGDSGSSVDNYTTLRKIDSQGNEVWSFVDFATPPSGYIGGLAVEPDGSHVYGTAYDSTLRKIDSSGNEVWFFDLGLPGASVAVEDDGSHVYANASSKKMRKVDSSGNEVWSFSGVTGGFGIAVEDDSTHIYLGANPALYKVDSTGAEVWSFTGFTGRVRGVAVDSSGTVYAGSNDNTLRKIDSQGNEVWSFTGFTNSVYGVAVEDDGSHIYASSFDDTLRKIDSSGTEVWSFTGFTDNIRDVAVEDDGSHVYGASDDGTLRKIDSLGNEVWSFAGFDNPVYEVAVTSAKSAASSADQATAGRIGQGFATGGDNYVDVGDVGSNIQTVAFWVKPDTDTEGLVQLSGSVTISLSSGSVSTSGFSSPTVYVDGEQTSSGVTAGEWHHVVITDTSDITADEVEVGHDGASALNGAVDDFRLFNTALSDRLIQRVYQLGQSTRVGATVASAGDAEAQLAAHWTFDGQSVDWGSGNVSDVAGSNAGSLGGSRNVYGASEDTTLRKIDSQGNQVWSFTGFTADVFGVAVSDDGSAVYGAGYDSTLRKIDSAGNEVWSFTGFTAGLSTVAAEDDGSNVYASAFSIGDYSVRKIDSAGNEVWSFTGFTYFVYGIATESDGSYVYGASQDRTLRKIDSAGNQVWSFTGFGDTVNSVAVSDGSTAVYAGADDNTLRKINSQGNQVWSFTGFSESVDAVAVTEDGSHVYAGSTNSLRKIDSSGNEVWSFAEIGGVMMHVAVSDDGDVYVAESSVVRKIDSQGNEVWSFTGFTGGVRGVAVDNPSVSSRDYVTQGNLGQALSFSGNDNSVDAGDVGSTIQTVAFWVKPDTDSQDILQLSNSVSISLSSGSVSTTGFTSPTVYVDGQQTTSGVTAGEWNHIVVTDSSNITADSVKLGEVGGTYYEGAIDDVRLYTGVLSTEEISRLVAEE
jgi:hypothetical protein